MSVYKSLCYDIEQASGEVFEVTFMYSLIIVDDEAIIRNGLANNFDWCSTGFTIQGLFEDGKDAMEYLANHPVDVVLTDVRMYEVSGIELARHISELYPRTVVVILSGYREFEYAQSAVKYGVFDYMLKPVEIDQLQETADRLRQLLDKRQGEPGAAALPFDFCNLEEYEEILSCNAKLAAAVASGDTEGVFASHEEWFGRIMNAPPEFILPIVTNMVESIYARLERMGVEPGFCGSKEAIFVRLGAVNREDLFAETGGMLIEFCNSLSAKKEGNKEAIVERAKQYIEKNLAGSLTVDDIARGVFLSVSYFSRCFKAATGENVIDHIIKRRMEKAIELIRENRLPISQIAETVGYADVKYFQRAFKKFSGYTVKEYRRIIS